MAATITAKVSVRKTNSVAPNKARFSLLSDVIVRAEVKGEKAKVYDVARRTIPGQWNEAQALKEFKKNPKSFKGTVEGADLAAYAALVP